MAKFNAMRIQKMVEDSFASSKSVTCRWHGIGPDESIDRLVTPPRSERFVKSRGVGFLWLWVVFDEDPSREDSYLIVLDPRSERYGLATKRQGRKHGRFLGFTGASLGEAIGDM